MPHLSPLNWLITPLTFWILLLTFMSILWWSQTSHFPPLYSSFTLPRTPQWNW
uniref:ATP synthase F0 subunit 8 n=1 Tax=Lepidonotopodium sp. YZ-2018 TaxID=2153333 RepID=A0A343W683_9ANNE|nr:ATP synthase F0 subunit 8 [Lepidonotopodium sp. YZ-2018]